MRLYLSGWQASRRERELAVIQAGALKHRCFSFAMIQKIPGLPYYLAHLEGSYQACLENGIGIMMDSGVVSYRSHKNSLIKAGKSIEKLATQDQFIEQYVEYVKANQHLWDIYFTVDLERHAEKILGWHKKLLAMGVKPVPVVHGEGEALEYLKKYRDLGHKLIGLGTNAAIRSRQFQFRHYLDAMFDAGAKWGLEFHGLALTAPWMLLEYPWWSADSSSWSRAAGYGTIFRFEETTSRMSGLHISVEVATGARGIEVKQNATMMGRIKKEIESEGFDFELMRRDFVTRHVWNAKEMMKLVAAAERRQKTGWKLLF
jgi:hypothetical protein